MTTTQHTEQPTLYRGRVKGRDYEVRAHHGVVDTRATVIIDGIELDAEALQTQETVGKVVHTVRRPDATGTLRNAEQIVVRTAGIGGKGEVDVLGGADPTDISRTPLAPEKGSASREREQRRVAHPVRFALVSAGAAGVKFLVPLLGIGALLSGMLRPVREGIAPFLQSVRELIQGVLSPIGRALVLWLAGRRPLVRT